MPRDGSNIYHRPPGTDGIPNYTIESAKYNANVADVEQDLNLPRPIVAGGTGANNARDAMIALSGEIAKQVVTNFDSFPWVNGSFYAAAGATNAPNGTNRFAGIYYGNADDSYATVEAFDQTTGIKYTRKKVAGVWDTAPAWAQAAGSVTDTDARYVNVTGDTMTGVLNGTDLNMTGAIKAGSGGTTGTYHFGNTGVKTLSYDGTNFNLVGGPLTVNGSVVASGGHVQAIDPAFATRGTCHFGNTGLRSLSYDGTNFNLSGGNLVCGGSVTAAALTTGTGTTGNVSFGNTGTKSLNYNGTKYDLTGGSLTVNGAAVIATSHIVGTNAGIFTGSPHLLVRPDLTGGLVYFQSFDGAANWASIGSGSIINYSGVYYGTGVGRVLMDANVTLSNSASASTTLRGSDGALIHSHAAYKPGGGAWADSSDARIKNVEGDYTRGLEDVAQLRPVYFTFKGNDTAEAPAHTKTGDVKQDAINAELPLTVPYPNSAHSASAQSAIKYAGLIAQEAELVFPEMVTQTDGYIDGQAVTDLRTLDTSPLIFALVNAVKELKARVEELEAA